MIRDIPGMRTNRKLAAWSELITSAGLLAAVIYFEYRVGTLGLVLGAFVGFSVARLAHQYFARNPDKKLVDLLLRYVDDDPEALRQLYGDLEHRSV